MKNILITGGLGFVGINIATRLSNNGFRCVLVDDFYRSESKKNLNLIKGNKNIEFIQLDITDFNKTEILIKKEKFYAILNFAGQVAMSKSLENPIKDFNINAFGSLCLLESIRKHSRDTLYLFSSTNKVYGDLTWDKLNSFETRYESIDYKYGYKSDLPIMLSTPYGCSKGIADLYALDYFKSFGIRTLVLRLSSIYGINQHSTYDQGWIGWFVNEAINKKNNMFIDVLGNGKQVRDILYIKDLEELILQMIDKPEFFNGAKFNVGGGYENSLSIIELIQYLSSIFNKSLLINKNDERISDQKYYVSNIAELENLFSWNPKINKYDGIENYIKYVKNSK